MIQSIDVFLASGCSVEVRLLGHRRYTGLHGLGMRIETAH